MRGFVITIISISLIVLLLTFAAVLHNNYLSLERVLTVPQSLTYANFMFDSVSHDVQEIVGPEMRSVQRNDSVVVTISDTLPNENFSGDLASYENHLENDIADYTNSIIDANFSQLDPYNFNVVINEDLVYSSMSDKAVFTGGASSYDILVITKGKRANLTPMEFNSSGDLNVSITYLDFNGTVNQSGQVFASKANEFTVKYLEGEELQITVGRENGEDGSLSIWTQNLSSTFTFTAVLPPIDETKKIGYEYNASMNYSQGKVYVRRKINT